VKVVTKFGEEGLQRGILAIFLGKYAPNITGIFWLPLLISLFSMLGYLFSYGTSLTTVLASLLCIFGCFFSHHLIFRFWVCLSVFFSVLWIGIVLIPDQDSTFHFHFDPDPYPDWHQNKADPHTDPTPSFTYVGN
jgi:hypothetical protein